MTAIVVGLAVVALLALWFAVLLVRAFLTLMFFLLRLASQVSGFR
jgi:hypothetical protein